MGEIARFEEDMFGRLEVVDFGDVVMSCREMRMDNFYLSTTSTLAIYVQSDPFDGCLSLIPIVCLSPATDRIPFSLGLLGLNRSI